jgi:hypothetical protein
MVMPAPKANKPQCDTPGCGALADRSTDGTEKDSSGLERKALALINICAHHENWPFSEDCAQWAIGSANYKARVAGGK